MSAPFSPIMIVAALVLPDTTAGMIEASTREALQSRATAAVRRSRRPRLCPHPAGADGMVGGGAASADEIEQLVKEVAPDTEEVEALDAVPSLARGNRLTA